MSHCIVYKQSPCLVCILSELVLLAEVVYTDQEIGPLVPLEIGTEIGTDYEAGVAGQGAEGVGQGVEEVDQGTEARKQTRTSLREVCLKECLLRKQNLQMRN